MCRKDIFEGRIETIKKLCNPNEKFLQHMFRYNQTLKSFSEILTKGRFEVLEQYNEKDVWNYFKDIYFSYTEKGNNYIGHMDTKTKLDFFPTAYEFQYLTLINLLRITIKPEETIKKQTLEFIKENTGDSYNYIDEQTYFKLIDMGRFDIIDEVFRAKLNYNENNEKLVIADLFAGEGEWLNLFRKMCYYNQTYIIANEIEFNRFKECKNKKFNLNMNYAFEELDDKIPKKFINIMLFNPPYGETDGERNVKRFFNMMIKNKFLCNTSKVVFVLNTDDVLLIYNDINKYFKLSMPIRLNNKEADRLDQICFIGELMNKNEKGHNLYSVERFIELSDYSLEKYYKPRSRINNYQYYNLKNINNYFDSLKVYNNPNLYLSDIKSSSWNNIINQLTIDTFQGKKIKLAEKPKDIGTAANLISSGLINGEIEGEHEHCIAAGISEQQVKSINEDGNIEIIKKSMPFLSVLNGGKIFEITSAKTNDNVLIQDDGTVVVI